MGITGDSIVIKENLEFCRVENLKKGDKLLSLNGSCTINSIDKYYSNEGYIFKTNNFFEFNLDKNVKILSSKLNKVYDVNTKKNKIFLLEETFEEVRNLNSSNLIPIKSIEVLKTDIIEELWIYAKLILKGELQNDKIVFKNFSEKFSKYKNNTNLKIDIEKNSFNKILLEKEDLEWIDFLNKQLHQRVLYEKLFYLNEDDFLFL